MTCILFLSSSYLGDVVNVVLVISGRQSKAERTGAPLCHLYFFRSGAPPPVFFPEVSSGSGRQNIEIFVREKGGEEQGRNYVITEVHFCTEDGHFAF